MDKENIDNFAVSIAVSSFFMDLWTGEKEPDENPVKLYKIPAKEKYVRKDKNFFKNHNFL
jgi:hypothetical protein